jgi:Flp pilus assembly protein CpaB
VVRSTGSWKPRRGIVLAVRRSALLWWTLTLTLAVLTASVVSSSIGNAKRGADAWGRDRVVWVVQRPLAAGVVVTAATVRRVALPRGVIPDGALAPAVSPVGDATRVALATGEVVLTARLARHGARGIAAVLPAGTRAVALPNDEHTPLVRVGDFVDVIATFDVGDATDAPSVAVASGAPVMAVAPRTLTVAVGDDDAARVAFALAKGAVTVVLRSAVSAPPRSR